MKTIKSVISNLCVLIIVVCSVSSITLHAMPKKNNISLYEASGGIKLPDGFKATVFADNIGRARHITVRDDGVVYVALLNKKDNHGIVALKDNNKNGVADEVIYFGDVQGTGIGIYNNHLYFGTNNEIVRWKFKDDKLIPEGDLETVVSNFIPQTQHAAKPFTFDEQGNIYINIGAPSNACQKSTRTPGSPGLEPCPQLKLQAGIWRYNANKLNQRHGVDGEHYAIGVRNAMALSWNHNVNHLFIAPHDRDDLHRLFPKYYSIEQNAILPDEAIFIVKKGDNMGWPSTYWDNTQNARMLSPEYGGDGLIQVNDSEYKTPIATVPGHWAPNAMVSYTSGIFPKSYNNGLFIAYHGSWNRAPLPQAGYNVAFFPLNKQGEPNEDWFVFAEGFKGKEVIHSPGEAAFRPVGLAVDNDGALYVSDSVHGRIWKITYSMP